MDVGDLHVDAIIDGSARFEPTLSFRGTTPEQWEVHRDLLDADGKLEFTMGGFLLRGRGFTALVDLGLGPRAFLGINGGTFMSELARLGVSPEDVTDVLFTHLHFDHIGWASADGQAVFPRARYRCAAPDWQHFIVEHPGVEAELLRPAEERFELWDGGTSLLPGVDALEAPGHTPGSTVMVLSGGSDRAMLLGDVVHCPVELVDDEWASLWDVDPALAKRTRIALSKELEGGDIPAAAAHFPGLQFGRLLMADGRRHWVV
jgi:glyoxylase-like metal-dependent hydrolase (beta-lactamase superfamily II)